MFRQIAYARNCPARPRFRPAKAKVEILKMTKITRLAIYGLLFGIVTVLSIGAAFAQGSGSMGAGPGGSGSATAPGSAVEDPEAPPRDGHGTMSGALGGHPPGGEDGNPDQQTDLQLNEPSDGRLPGASPDRGVKVGQTPTPSVSPKSSMNGT